MLQGYEVSEWLLRAGMSVSSSKSEAMGAGDGQMNLHFICSNVGAAPVCCGKERAQPKSKTLDFLVSLRSDPHPWSSDIDHNQRTRSQIQVAKMTFLLCGWTQP
ncbi:hypothetical protein CHARACLAT_006874 [Characodon lateralis]|uniref:Uncharacterized protein n=1 Tax=Characodon lateralis TaxID=208331 RepID=A0ABU7F0S8_9TELE|nr:hypothetical protein [Characodon lateralis]